jgi:hypothetical protein
MENMKLWNAVKQPPKEALKTIGGGRLRGMTDINPQWRLEAMTEQFGPCGVGWKCTIDKLWTEPGPDGQVFAFALVSVFYREGENWSEPVPGVGGNYLVELEKKGLHANDEGFKMAVTDALSVALKALGFGADIYAGRWDGSKYLTPAPHEPTITKSAIADLQTMVDDLVKAGKLKSQDDFKQRLKKKFRVDEIAQLGQKQAEALANILVALEGGE